MDSTLPLTVLPNEAGSNDQRKGRGRRSSSGLQPPSVEDVFNCPRCDSSNTKFCYYNNYSFTQPRYYCKACRRYWTRGGTLRNVPIGSGCRKNKKSKPSSHYFSSSSSPSSSSSFTTTPSLMNTPFKLFHGLSSSSFNLGTSERFPSSRFKYSTGTFTSDCGLLTNEFSNISISNSCQGVVGARRSSSAVASSDLLGGPHVNTPKISQYSITSNANMTYYTTCTLASNIDAASSPSINSCQDLYWKLQQQRLGFNNLYGGQSHETNISTKETSAPTSYHIHQNQQHRRSVSFHTPVSTESDLGLVPGTNVGSFVGDNGMIPTPSNDDDHHHHQYWLNNTCTDGGGSSNWNSTTRSNNTDEKCIDVLKTLNEMHHLIGALPFGSN